MISTLAVDGWTVTFGTARRSLGGLRPRLVPSSLYILQVNAGVLCRYNNIYLTNCMYIFVDHRDGHLKEQGSEVSRDYSRKSGIIAHSGQD